jgi:hypothetical protein
VCKGTSFVDRRDTAVIILFLDTGMRHVGAGRRDIDDLEAHREQQDVDRAAATVED